MSVANIPIPFSFVQFAEAGSYGNCEAPVVELPILNPKDLSFQLNLNTPPNYQYGQKTFIPQYPYPLSNGSFQGSISGDVLTVTAPCTNGIRTGQVLIGAGVPPGTIIEAYLTGTGGGGTYQINISLSVSTTTMTTNVLQPQTEALGTLAAVICVDGEPLPFDIQWIATAASFNVNNSETVFYFQYTGQALAFENLLSSGQCFNICIYQVALIQSVGDGPFFTIDGCGPFSTVGQLVTPALFCSTTLFYKITDECESYPTSVLQYANFSDAFGFYYNYLGQLMQPGINFLNSIRLPLYLHSPQTTEDEMSYNKSDGSRLKLSHRIWTDYKFKTDYLDRFCHKCLAVATAHDLVYITCHYEGLDPSDTFPVDGGFVYENNYQTDSPTQFIRTEKIEVEWQQEDRPRWKLGQAKGTLRLAVAASLVNSNCL